MYSIYCLFFFFFLFVCFFFFFFQAEDGIRDLVRSRGLGDVYKRQGLNLIHILISMNTHNKNDGRRDFLKKSTALAALAIASPAIIKAVSYTHLTLPTSDLV